VNEKSNYKLNTCILNMIIILTATNNPLFAVKEVYIFNIVI
jgi:hypothetical protein